MPKYTEKTARNRAISLVKPLIRNGFNESKTARELGITPQAVNERLRHKPVRDVLQEFLASDELKEELKKVAAEGLKAEQYDMIGKPHPAHSVRHRFWRDLLISTGNLKTDGSSGIKIINIIHAYRKENNADKPRD